MNTDTGDNDEGFIGHRCPLLGNRVRGTESARGIYSGDGLQRLDSQHHSGVEINCESVVKLLKVG